MVLTRINGKYNLEVKDVSRTKLIIGLTQIGVMLKEETDSKEDAFFITDLIDEEDLA